MWRSKPYNPVAEMIADAYPWTRFEPPTQYRPGNAYVLQNETTVHELRNWHFCIVKVRVREPVYKMRWQGVDLGNRDRGEYRHRREFQTTAIEWRVYLWDQDDNTLSQIETFESRSAATVALDLFRRMPAYDLLTKARQFN